MFKLLLRCLFFIGGAVLLSDTALPLRDETLRVDQHTSHVNDGELVESNRHWRWIAMVIGAVLIAVAIGWLRADDEDGSISLA